MATIRQWLTEEGFDWEASEIIWQHHEDNECPGWSSPTTAAWIKGDHPILDQIDFYLDHKNKTPYPGG